jgi:hypothetical protein
MELDEVWQELSEAANVVPYNETQAVCFDVTRVAKEWDGDPAPFLKSVEDTTPTEVMPVSQPA